ncbi:PepSY-associated TM helix domain-containing protein [Planctomyces sp. SH-PL14]|uniref:PepSY-associated TM helix domain-containing protein n=1 Tax=Planctomyces sp. SH-PL14 TaxID=1632864 RepID=UPI00078D9EB3|nr:PepSY domain-containing protein [Planctomyces sp. SH-PL14]AMV20355.1 PepSY-associated TM helix [Planctomyces sp. SH-PL14]
MTDSNASPRASWPDYRAVWRWHFYAGLLCTPFVILLSITGAIYLFKPQIDAWVEAPYDHVERSGTVALPSEQVAAAVAAFPGSTPTGYELPVTDQAAPRVLVRDGGETMRVYVHPDTRAVLHSVPEADRFLRQIFRLHGELLMGDRGSNIVELAASWTIIMILTGLYLWWPRNARGLGGVLYPRLRKGRSIFWRDIHSVTGIWISTLALFLLFTGLPWAKFWGTYFKSVREWTGTAVAQQDWTVGGDRSGAGRSGGGGGGEHSGHGGGGGRGGRGGGPSRPVDLAGFDVVAAAVRPLDLPPPVVIAPPSGSSENWTAKSMIANRPRRVNLVVNGRTGEIVSREDFRDRHWVDRVVGTGIAAHEGQLFGWVNQLLGLLAAVGLVLLSVSGVVMWWRRRDVGALGAPKVLLSPRWSLGLVTLIGLLAALLPLFGASLLLVAGLERVCLRRIPRVRDWLGLGEPSRPVEAAA